MYIQYMNEGRYVRGGMRSMGLLKKDVTDHKTTRKEEERRRRRKYQ
jgi:hypothetical protein